MNARAPRLFVSVSPHGLGHAAITAPVLNAAWAVMPELAVTVHSTVSRSWLDARLARPFAYTGRTRDFGMVMTSPTDIDVGASAERYAALLADWDDAVAEERARIRASGAALVVANISFVTLAAARAEGVPAISLCPFDWAEVYGAYCADAKDARAVLDVMGDAYASAAAVLRPAPAVPSSRPGLHPIGPIAATGLA
ncbi:MAG: hypothetical protein HQL35_10870, partial [Alphaproteobacteria bacterium]|nr:hypothetical protein [Alphaproteobacteria bacterium]